MLSKISKLFKCSLEFEFLFIIIKLNLVIWIKAIIGLVQILTKIDLLRRVISFVYVVIVLIALLSYDWLSPKVVLILDYEIIEVVLALNLDLISISRGIGACTLRRIFSDGAFVTVVKMSLIGILRIKNVDNWLVNLLYMRQMLLNVIVKKDFIILVQL